MLTFAQIEDIVHQEHLFISGSVTQTCETPAPAGVTTLLLLSPDEPSFWPAFETSPECADGAPDPLDRWSAAAAGRLIPQIPGATVYFPFGGPPWHPFIGWAKASGRAVASPVGLLAHDRSGLFISYRMALGLTYSVDQPPRPAPACTGCAAPCADACPVSAFASGSYDVPRCKSHIRSDAGHDCLSGGCRVRRACPVGQDRRLNAQSQFHMKAFA